MEEGLFSGEGENIAAPGSAGSSRRTSASGQFAFQPLTSRQSTPSSTDSPDAFTPFTADASVPTASTSPPFATGFRARSIETAVLPGTGLQLKGDKGTPISQDWRSGTGGGPFTVDAGGTNKFNTGHNNNSGYTPLAGPSSNNSHQATFASNLSSSFPSQPLAWNPPTLDAQSYSGTPSPLLSQSYSSYTSFDQSSAAIPIAPSSYQNHYTSPNQSLVSSPRDPALLALHSSLAASQGLNNLGFAQQVLSSSQSNGRGRTKSGSRNEPLSFASISPSQQTPSIFPSPSNSSFDSSRTTYQRPVPPLPRRPSGSGSFRPSALSNTYQGAAPIASTSAVQTFYQPPTPIQGLAGIPPVSRPASPRVPGVAYDFTSLEKDLDNFSSGSGGGFASAAAAAMASVGSSNGGSNRTAGPAVVGSYVGASNGYVPPSPLLHNTDILSEPFYAKLPLRTPSGSNGLRSFAPSPGELDFFGLDMGGSGGSIVPSPVNSSDSPSSSTIIDQDSAEALAKKDPIAAQVWRMFNKAKHSLPNGARMENLTWRLMSMTLKKRREETAAAEAAATILRQEEEEASEALDGVGAGRDQSGLQRRSTQLSQGEITKTFAEAEGRGRKGRASASPQSASESPEGFEEDFMDWRAKSQSRSRSRAPDAAMDWRAQSRSRSRAPAFRTPMPPPETFPATAHVSRFHNDTSSSGENAAFSLAASLGLGPPANSFPGSPGFEGVKADLESTPPSFSFPSDPSSPELADPNLSAIADTLNELILLQSIATSAAGTPQATATGGWLGSDSLAAIGTPTSQAGTVEKNIVAGQNSFVDETIYGGPYGFLVADQASNPMSAEQQLHQLLSQSTNLGYSAPTAAASKGQQSTFSSPYLNATALAAGRNFGLHHPAASGLSLARPSHMLPETSHPPTPGHSVPQSPAYVYPSSAPVHNFINPFQNSYYGTESNLSNQQDYFSPASLASSYSSSYQAGFPQDAPTSINPTHLLSNLHTPQLYESDPNTWGISPQSTNTHSPLDGTSSPKTAAAAVKPSLSHHTSAPVSRSGSVNAMRSNSTPDLVGLGKAASSLGMTNRNHVRSSTLGMTPADAESGLLVATTAIPKKDLVPTGAETTCLNCSTTNTPLWRRDLDGRPLCNACGLFRNLHGIDRPRTLNTGVIKKRNRQRGPKDQVPKKPLTAGRAAAARRNSGNSPPPPRSLIRAGASAPYPSTADRAGQH